MGVRVVVVLLQNGRPVGPKRRALSVGGAHTTMWKQCRKRALSTGRPLNALRATHTTAARPAIYIRRQLHYSDLALSGPSLGRPPGPETGCSELDERQQPMGNNQWATTERQQPSQKATTNGQQNGKREWTASSLGPQAALGGQNKQSRCTFCLIVFCTIFVPHFAGRRAKWGRPKHNQLAPLSPINLKFARGQK